MSENHPRCPVWGGFCFQNPVSTSAEVHYPDPTPDSGHVGGRALPSPTLKERRKCLKMICSHLKLHDFESGVDREVTKRIAIKARLD